MSTQGTTIPLSQLQDIMSSMVYATEADTLDQVLQRIADVARKLTGAKYAALGIPDATGKLIMFEVSGMHVDEIARMPHPPVGAGLLGAILKDRETLRLAHMKDDERSVGFPENHPHMTSLLGVPIQVGEQVLGLLYISDREDEQPFSQYDQWLIEALARYAALVVVNSQLRENQRTVTLLQERERIGMELHDGVIQSLYGLGMHLDLLRSNVNTTPADFQPIIDGLNDIIEDIRNYIMGLKSDKKQSKSIYQSFCDTITHLYIPQKLEINIEAPDIPPNFKDSEFESICLIAREALSNAVRHANPKTIYLNAWQDSQHFKMTIRDDGDGFKPERLNNEKGLGLRNIQERVRLHGGLLAIISTPGQGTSVTITIPFA